MSFSDKEYDLMQLHMTFICEVMSRSIQYFRNNGELFEQTGDVIKSDFNFEVADYLNDLLDFIMNYYNFKKWCDNRNGK